MQSKQGDAWLARHREGFGTRDGFPGEFHRECLFNAIKRPGVLVMILTPHGNRIVGRTVMKGPGGWVINTGGPHGTPRIASEENTIWVRGAVMRGTTIGVRVLQEAGA